MKEAQRVEYKHVCSVTRTLLISVFMIACGTSRLIRLAMLLMMIFCNGALSTPILRLPLLTLCSFAAPCGTLNCRRHRRLDKEALNLTRRAAEDALRWGGEVSSGAGDTSSSSVVRDRATPSSSSSFSSSRSRSGVRTDGADDKISPSRNDFSLSEGGDGPSMTLGMHTIRRSGTDSCLPGNVVGDAISADGGADPVTISWDHKTVEPMARPGQSVPGLAGRWRLGSAGSQAALGLWAQGSGAEKSGTYDAELSPRGDADTAPEVSPRGIGGCCFFLFLGGRR